LRSTLSEITIETLNAILSGDPDELGVHLQIIERDVTIGNTKVRLHCHCMTVDANGRVRLARLAEFMRSAIADYAIPRAKLTAARERDARFKSSSSVSQLHYQARSVFTDLEKSGEGGEMLLYLLAERFLRKPQVLCKMDLKTDSRMHYHGADGVYADVDETGILKLYWGESKIYGDATTAIRDCLSSLAPFLIEHDSESSGRERDIILLSDKADLDNPDLTSAFKRYFDTTSPMSTRVKYCGIALIGFDADFYPSESATAVADKIAEGARQELTNWAGNIANRVAIEKLEMFEIEFLCVPIPSADSFRKAFREALGIK
jgi:hypothetical protein